MFESESVAFLCAGFLPVFLLGLLLSSHHEHEADWERFF